MTEMPIQQALDDIRRIRAIILEKRHFRGFSGIARILSGIIALLGAGALSTDFVPRINGAHFIGWGIVLLLASLLNYGALLQWFLFDPQIKRDRRMLLPLVDVIPPLAVGATVWGPMRRVR